MDKTQEDVGKLFTIQGNDAWRMSAYTEQPVITMKNIETGETEMLVATSPRAKEFQSLIPVTSIEQPA
jgi:hypothetical protein